MATKVPCRVLRGSGGSGGSYYWDGVNPMTTTAGGIGAVLVSSTLFDLPTVTFSNTSDFDGFQTYLINRKRAFDQLAACESCPTQTAAELLASL